ncbi:MAG TPA: M28 family peptidase, partial [Polyangiales bacterium]|nr:M28 family peptidase [Polyangiales bacterium]
VIESDNGAGKPLGLSAWVTPTSVERLRSLHEILLPLGAAVLRRSERTVGSDIDAWQLAGVPGFQLLVDGRTYFDYHHTAADTLDKVDPKNLQRMVATLAVLSLYLTDTRTTLERVPVAQ